MQLPFNLAMPEALTRPNQMIDGKPVPMVQAARKLGISLITSAALLQGQLAKNLPPFVATALGSKENSKMCIRDRKQVERQEIETFRSAKPAKSSPNATIGDAIMAKRQSS